jgi:hypothetical protein
MAGVVTCGIVALRGGAKRWRTPCCASSMACASAGDSGGATPLLAAPKRQVPADQAVQARQHGFGMFAAARQRRRARHHARLFAHAAMARAHEAAGDRGVERPPPARLAPVPGSRTACHPSLVPPAPRRLAGWCASAG